MKETPSMEACGWTLFSLWLVVLLCVQQSSGETAVKLFSDAEDNKVPNGEGVKVTCEGSPSSNTAALEIKGPFHDVTKHCLKCTEDKFVDKGQSCDSTDIELKCDLQGNMTIVGEVSMKPARHNDTLGVWKCSYESVEDTLTLEQGVSKSSAWRSCASAVGLLLCVLLSAATTL